MGRVAATYVAYAMMLTAPPAQNSTRERRLLLMAGSHAKAAWPRTAAGG